MIDKILVCALTGAVITVGLIFLLLWVQEKRKKDSDRGKIGKLLNILVVALLLFALPWLIYFLWSFLNPGPGVSCNQRTEIGCDDSDIESLNFYR